MYGKLFAQMYDGTLATKGPWQAMVTFQQLIILADKGGIVDMTAEAIARRTTIPIEIINIGITALEQTDADSRTPTEEGRRIVRLSPDREWGWRIVNHEHYRRIRTQEERREYMRIYQQKRRAACKQDVSNVSEVNQMQYAGSSNQKAVDVKSDSPTRADQLQNPLKKIKREPQQPDAETIEKNRRIAAALATGNNDLAQKIKDGIV